jgi:hypothetical protein
MDRKSNNDFDKMSRLTAEDREMFGRLQQDKAEKLENNNIATTSLPPSLSSTPTPPDTSFLTEEKMKKIIMPKKIEF